MTRWLVTGAGGMLGSDVMARLSAEGGEVAGLGRADLDVTDPAAVAGALARIRPDVVVNCAAWTAVDDAESHPAEAMRVNGDGPRTLAEGCLALPATRLVHVSTDYVFSGDAVVPYAEDAETGPCSVYGHTKLAGERAVLEILPPGRRVVVRTAWLYGAHGPNFVRTMMRLAAERDRIDVVTAQRGQPTWTADLADRLVLLGARPDADGIYHGTSAGEATWFALAQEVFTLLGTDPERVRPVESMRRAARRPAYGVLGHERWKEVGIDPIRDWRAALAAAFPSMRG
jgi:dTDP-4-dehydrorhamnose reductase